jgi:hypothetical protein
MIANFLVFKNKIMAVTLNGCYTLVICNSI